MADVDGLRFDPLRGYKFKVVIPNMGEIGFKKVSGLRIGVAKTAYREGTDRNTQRKLPGQAEFDTIKLERGVTNNVDVIKWMQQIHTHLNESDLPDDSTFRRDIYIYVLNRQGKSVRVYQALACWPVDLKLDDLDAMSNDVLIETLELEHEELIPLAATTDIDSVSQLK